MLKKLALAQVAAELPADSPAMLMIKQWHDGIVALDEDYAYQQPNLLDEWSYKLQDLGEEAYQGKFPEDQLAVLKKINIQSLFKQVYGKSVDQLSKQVDDEASAKIFDTSDKKKLQKYLKGMLLPSSAFDIKNTQFYARGKAYVFQQFREASSLSEKDLVQANIPGFTTMDALLQLMKSAGAQERGKPKRTRRPGPDLPLYD